MFRPLIREITELMCFEACRNLPLVMKPIETPITAMESPVLADPSPCVVSILRAGNGMIDCVLSVVPTASVGFVGLYRDPKTLKAVEYYYKMPENIADRDVLLVDPMLATGHSAAAAIGHLKAVSQPKSIRLMSCLLYTSPSPRD